MYILRFYHRLLSNKKKKQKKEIWEALCVLAFMVKFFFGSFFWDKIASQRRLYGWLIS